MATQETSRSVVHAEPIAAPAPRLWLKKLGMYFLLLLGAIPAWPYSRDWGYAPSGTLRTVLVIDLILVLLRQI